jgi:hypothetical protein
MPKTKVVSQLVERFEDLSPSVQLNTLHIESAILEGENIVKYEFYILYAICKFFSKT